MLLNFDSRPRPKPYGRGQELEAEAEAKFLALRPVWPQGEEALTSLLLAPPRPAVM